MYIQEQLITFGKFTVRISYQDYVQSATSALTQKQPRPLKNKLLNVVDFSPKAQDQDSSIHSAKPNIATKFC